MCASKVVFHISIWLSNAVRIEKLGPDHYCIILYIVLNQLFLVILLHSYAQNFENLNTCCIASCVIIEN